MQYTNKKILIVGGGSAGWLTALYLKTVLPNNPIKLIESEKIGILGAGEGTVPQLMTFIHSLGIDVFDLIKQTKGTVKNGISFENWNGDNSKYFHAFADKFDFSVGSIFSQNGVDYQLQNVIAKNLNPDNHTYASLLSYQNKVDTHNIQFAVHFDARLLADYLKEIAIQRGVEHCVGEVEQLKSNDNQEITAIVLDNKVEHQCNFVFDCSGFARLIIGKHYNEKWISYKEHLPMKSAVPFFLDNDEQIKPYTQAIAMKYGWMWKIPLQHRIGAGYIYDSDYISSSQALEEAESFLGRKLQSPKTITFEPGRYDRVWVKNCIAVGLSSGFVEPLEATSLQAQAAQLSALSYFIPELFNSNRDIVDYYNRLNANNNDNILDFLYLHYLTQRNDSKFWKEFKEKNKPTERIKEVLPLFARGNFNIFSLQRSANNLDFPLASYIQICYGTKQIKQLKDLCCYTDITPTVEKFKSYIDELSNKAISHNLFLERNNY